MARFLHDKNNCHKSIFLCVLAFCIFIACCTYQKPELEDSLFLDKNNTNTVLSLGDIICDIVADENTSFSTQGKNSLRNPGTEWMKGFKPVPIRATINITCVFIGLIGLLLGFYRDLITSHKFIISYIHSLDGMKS